MLLWHRAFRPHSLLTKFVALALFLSLWIPTIALAQWAQLGADIDGDMAGDASGKAVTLSADGNRVAIGASGSDGFGNGVVRVYDWNGSAWVKVGEDILGDSRQFAEQSGSSVALSNDGNRLAVGARGHSAPFEILGTVRVYDWNGSDWIQVGADIDGEQSFDQSGYSVALSADGGRLAVGAPGVESASPDAINERGTVRVYDWNGADWVKVGADITGEGEFDRSGYSVDLSADGSHLAIGAPRNEGTGIAQGHVRVYDWDGSDWEQVGTDLDATRETPRSGTSVALSADGARLAVEAEVAVQVYDWNGSGWEQAGFSINLKPDQAYDFTGTGIALSADGVRLATGAGGRNVPGNVRLYDWSVTDRLWVEVGSAIDGEAGGDQNGRAVALSADGDRLAVGAPGNDGNGDRSGHVRVYNAELWVTKRDELEDDIGGDELVNPGDTLRYSIAINNASTTNALGVMFSDTLDSNTSLVSGSVDTTQGIVTTGNGAGDTEVVIDVGNVTASNPVFIEFDAVVNQSIPLTATEVSNQAEVSGTDLPRVLSDDPDTAADGDATQTSIAGVSARPQEVIPVPIFNRWGLLALIMMMLVLPVVVRRWAS